MEEKLVIQATTETPEVNFDSTSGKLFLSGRSLPENAFEFYSPLLDWLTAYSSHSRPLTELEINLEYLNSGSLKQIFRVIYKLEDLMELGNEIKISWKYKKGDELMMQKGHEFKQFLEVPIELFEI